MPRQFQLPTLRNVPAPSSLRVVSATVLGAKPRAGQKRRAGTPCPTSSSPRNIPFQPFTLLFIHLHLLDIVFTKPNVLACINLRVEPSTRPLPLRRFRVRLRIYPRLQQSLWRDFILHCTTTPESRISISSPKGAAQPSDPRSIPSIENSCLYRCRGPM